MELTGDEYYEARCKQIQCLLVNNNPNPYPHKFHVSTTHAEFIKLYDEKCTPKLILEDVKVSIAGRISAIRTQAKNLIFYDLRSDGLKL